MASAQMVGGPRGQFLGLVFAVSLLYHSTLRGNITAVQDFFSLSAGSSETARTPPPNVKMPTLHGVGAARNARSSEETDAFTTRNLAQAFLSTPPSRTPSPHDFMERGDNASLTPKPPRTIVGGPTNTPLINAHVTDDASTNANAST